MFQLARDLFMLMDLAILCFHFRKLHPPIFLKIIALFLIRNTLAITLTDLLKKDLTFKGRLMRVLLHFLLLLSLVVLAVVVAAVGVVVIVVGASDSDINSTSSCGSSKILTWTGKYKPGAIAGAWDGKYTLGTRAGKRIIFGLQALVG